MLDTKPVFQFTSPNFAIDPSFADQMLEAGPDWLTMAMVATMPEFVLILDRDRRVVFANASTPEAAAIGSIDNAIGKQVGELLNCANVTSPGSCGTTKNCRGCGYLRSVLTALNGRAAAVEHCITTKDGQALDLRVFTTPLMMNDQQFCSFAAKDISHEKRLQVLERVFFESVLETAEAVNSYVQMIQQEESQARNLSRPLYQAAQKLVSEIDAQRRIIAAERGKLDIQKQLINVYRFLTEIALRYADYSLADGREIVVEAMSLSEAFLTEPSLLSYILENMIMNALEASCPGQPVTVGCTTTSDTITFEVHNVTAIPRNVQVRIFSRSFTTKGAGRGLGTFTMRMLAERYLGGRVWFESSEMTGTTFYAEFPLESEPED